MYYDVVHAALRDARSARNLGDQSDLGDRQNFSENREVGVVRLC